MAHGLRIALFLLALFALFAAWDRLRYHRLVQWTAQNGSRLHWPFDPATQPGPFAAELTAALQGRGARLRGAAVEGHVNGRRAWIVEYEARRSLQTSGRWYCLCLIEAGAPAGGPSVAAAHAVGSAGPVAANGPWIAKHREGLLSVRLLQQCLQPALS